MGLGSNLIIPILDCILCIFIVDLGLLILQSKVIVFSLFVCVCVCVCVCVFPCVRVEVIHGTL